ncbi:MAG: endonuclease [Elusimicrobiota bacterium]
MAALLSTALAGLFVSPLHAQTAPPPVSGGFSALFDGAAQFQPAPLSFRAPRTSIKSAAASGSELLQALHDRVSRTHAPVGYSEARRHMFGALDNVTVDGVRGVHAVYSAVFVPGTSGNGGDYREQGDQNGDGYVDAGGMNAEHLWPQSYFKERLPMRADLHHLLPTFMHPNSVRGRLPFGEVAAADADYTNRAGARRDEKLFEPPDRVKGRVARGLLYFFTRYLGYNIIPSNAADIFWNRRIETLLRWNREFPPDAMERRRNDLAEKVQGNRNPFVDDPGLADQIGPEAFRLRQSKRTYTSSALRPRRP